MLEHDLVSDDDIVISTGPALLESHSFAGRFFAGHSLTMRGAVGISLAFL